MILTVNDHRGFRVKPASYEKLVYVRGPTSLVAHQGGAYPSFSVSGYWQHEATRSIPIDGLPPALNTPIPIYTPGWIEAL